MIDHIKSLERHGAKIKLQDGTLIPVNESFYRKAVNECKTGGYNAATYELVLPDIKDELWLAIWRDGHVDSGSPINICACLDR